MGNQSGRSGGIGTGRKALNPPDCVKVTSQQVLDKATELGLSLKREGIGMWFVWEEKKQQWYTLGQTNYLALGQLNLRDQ